MQFFRSPLTQTFTLSICSLILCFSYLRAELFRDLIIFLDPEMNDTHTDDTLPKLFRAAIKEASSPILVSSSLINPAHVTIDTEEWACVTTKILSFLVPRSYFAKVRKEAHDLKIANDLLQDTTDKSSYALCGFNLNFVKQPCKNNEEFAVNFITQLLKPDIAGHRCTWNILWIGHGDYSRKRFHDEDEIQVQEILIAYSEVKANKEARTSYVPTSYDTIRNFETEPNPEIVLIAGLHPKNIKKLLTFFNGKRTADIAQEQRELYDALEALRKKIAMQKTASTTSQETNDDENVRSLKKTVAQSWQAKTEKALMQYKKDSSAYKQHKEKLLNAPFDTQLDSAIDGISLAIKQLDQQRTVSPSITTGVVGILSCFVGGFNRVILEQMLQDMSFQGHVLSIGIGDVFVDARSLTASTNYQQFFKQTKQFLCLRKGEEEKEEKAKKEKDEEATKKEKKSAKPTPNPFLSIADTIGGNAWHNNLYSAWYIPGRKTFATYTLADNVFILNEVIKKKHETEKTVINACGYSVVLVKPMRVMTTLKIKWDAAIIPLRSPESESFFTTRFIKKLIIKKPAVVRSWNIFYAILRQKGAYPDLMLIKKLSCPLPVLKDFPKDAWPADSAKALAEKEPTRELFSKRITLDNVIITGKIPGTVVINCSYNQQNYSATITCQDYKITTEKILFMQQDNLDVAKMFAHLYQYIQRRDLDRSEDVTDEVLQNDNKRYKTTWAIETKEEKELRATIPHKKRIRRR